MKKISMKQLLVNAMEEHGKNLILSDRFWFRSQPALSRAKDIDKRQHIAVGGMKKWETFWNMSRYWISTISKASIWTGFISDFSDYMIGGNELCLWRRTWSAVCRPSARCVLLSGSDSSKQFLQHQGPADHSQTYSQYKSRFRRNLSMSMKKNLIKGMTELGEMLNVIGNL